MRCPQCRGVPGSRGTSPWGRAQQRPHTVPSPPSLVLEDMESKEVARITFVFETICSVGCELYFMVVSWGGTGSGV